MDRLPTIPWLPRSTLSRRARRIVSVFTRHGLGWILSRPEAGNASTDNLKAPENMPRQKQAQHLRAALSELGATFIKLGQALSTRPDMLPPEFIAELSKLQDEVPMSPFDQMAPVFLQEFGKPVHEIYAEFDPQPIASASIGQVYAARLKNGQKVVVKVRRPGVVEMNEKDLELLNDMAEWMTSYTAIGKSYDLPALLSEFSFRLRNELDYVREAQNANIFRKNFSGDPTVYIPYIYWKLTTTQVLTMERVGGVKISDVDTMKQEGINMRTVAENAGRFTLRQLFEFGFFHADPHPGNYFVQPDASLAVVDFGMVGKLTDQMKQSLLKMIISMAQGDADSLVDELLEIGATRRSIKRRSLTMDLGHIIERYVGGQAQFLTASQVMSEILNVAFVHGLTLPGEFAMLARLGAINEGVSMTLYPDFRMLDFAAPYVMRFWQQDRSPKKLIPRLFKSAMDGIELSLNLPRQASRLLKQIERGQLEFNINYEGLRQFSSDMQRMTNRLALAIILGATIVALGMIMASYAPPFWKQMGDIIFGFAFLMSIGLGFWFVISILRSGRGGPQ